MNTAMTRNRIGTLQIAIILLTVATALVHLYLSISLNWSLLFLANFVGYTVLITALYLPQLQKYHNLIRWALIIFAAATVVGWVIMGSRIWLGYIDKTIEVVLIICLFLEGRK